MIPLPVISCDGCGVCCSKNIGTPPFEPGEEPPDLPTEAVALIRRDRLWDLSGPCSWWDAETKRCRFYEHRPRSCQEYEVGGPDCRKKRGE